MSSLKKQIAFLKKLSLNSFSNIKIRYHAQELLNEILNIGLKEEQNEDFRELNKLLDNKNESHRKTNK